MISKQYIKDLEFNNIEEFFNYVVESKINGNYTQTKEFIKKMNTEQRHDFKFYLDSCFFDTETKEELINIMLEV